ncbi:MAG: hypothetical protein E7315_01675 [Clostridiales bacterium]|nr:hypothetical protein [Clostridiales bacterium]
MTRQDVLNSMFQQPAKNEDFFYLVQQSAVKHKELVQDPIYNAIWDFAISPEGRIFFSACGECQNAIYVKLYEYLPESEEFLCHFALNDKVIQHDRAIRPSKFHTGITFMPDGKMIMITHTTAKSHLHPDWLPRVYADHQFEAYQGSNLLIYDPNTGEFNDCGIMSQYETLYGGVYNHHNNTYYACGMLKGHLYACNLTDMSVRDYGQVSDGPTWKFYVGIDGNVYSATYSGILFMIDKDTGEVTFLHGLRVPTNRPCQHITEYKKDGTLFFTPSYTVPLMCSYNPATKEYKTYPNAMPKNLPDDCASIQGMAFDSKGRLWYSLMQKANGCRLAMWDIFNGGEPIDYGQVGTLATKGIVCSTELLIYDDIIYIADSNHNDDPVGVVVVDINKLDDDFLKDPSGREKIVDFICYNTVENGREMWPYGNMDAVIERWIDKVLKDANDPRIRTDDNDAYCPYPPVAANVFWHKIGENNTRVRHIEWADNETVTGIIGNDKLYSFTIKNNKIEQLIENTGDNDIPSLLKTSIPEELKLPTHPGRRYLSKAECSVKMADGTVIVGTHDGMLARIKDGKVYSLGMVVTCGGVHCLCTDSTGTTVYGVAGYELGLGCVFKYDGENGLKLLGMCKVAPAFSGDGDDVYWFYVTQPVVCAVSPDNTRLAIGTADRMGGVGIYSLIPPEAK